MRKPILFIVDDEPEICELLSQLLNVDFNVFCANTAQEAFQLLEKYTPDAVLSDVRMPGEDGIDLCKALRARLPRKDIPILMISAFDEPETRMRLFEAGADDFISKPFRSDELYVRLLSRLRRYQSADEPRPLGQNVIVAGNLRLDLDRVEARIESDRVPLGPVEFKILCLLVRGLGELRSREEISEFVWGDRRPASRALDPHINALRRKLEGSKLELRTVYGAGYSLRLKA